MVGFENFDQYFKLFLADILLLIVAIELSIRLIYRSSDILIQAMFFVVARKILIQTETSWELALGILALGALFASKKYLHS